MNKNTQEKTPQEKSAADIALLELFIEKADRIYKDLGELIGAMDKVYLEKKASGSAPWDFLTKDKRPANKED